MMATSACRAGPLTSARAMAGEKTRADRRAAEEADEAQDADDEALPVAGHGERCGERDQDQVQQVTGHRPTV